MICAASILALAIAPPGAPDPRFDPPAQYDGQSVEVTGIAPHMVSAEFWLHPGTAWSDDAELLASDYSEPFVLPASALAGIECQSHLITAHLFNGDGLWVGLLGGRVDFAPFGCTADYTDDCVVGVSDLLHVIGGWGQYGVFDLLAVLAQWGPC